MKTIDNAYKNEIQSFAFGFLTDIGLASYFSENYNKHLVGCSVFSITNGHRICVHTAE